MNIINLPLQLYKQNRNHSLISLFRRKDKTRNRRVQTWKAHCRTTLYIRYRSVQMWKVTLQPTVELHQQIQECVDVDSYLIAHCRTTLADIGVCRCGQLPQFHSLVLSSSSFAINLKHQNLFIYSKEKKREKNSIIQNRSKQASIGITIR